MIIFWTRFFAGSGPNLYNVYWTSSRAEELAEYDKIVLQTSKMVALGAVIKLYYVKTWISLHAWLLARLEMKFNLKLKLSHTWAAMLRLELDHLAQKIISKENPRGEGAFAVPCLSPLFWHYTMECWQINHISQNDTGTGIQIVYNSAQYSERKNLENGGYMAAFKWLSFSHTHTHGEQKSVSCTTYVSGKFSFFLNVILNWFYT